MVGLTEYIKSDVTVALVSLLKLNYYPLAILSELNQMQKLSIFKKDQCLRLLDTLVDFMQQKENTELSQKIVDKMIE